MSTIALFLFVESVLYCDFNTSRTSLKQMVKGGTRQVERKNIYSTKSKPIKKHLYLYGIFFQSENANTVSPGLFRLV